MTGHPVFLEETGSAAGRRHRGQRRPGVPGPGVRRSGLLPAVAAALAFMLAACTPAGDGWTPPPADVAGIQVVAVFPLANDTAQAGLEDELAARLLAGLHAVGWYEVVPMEAVAEQLARRRPSSLWNMDDETLVELARDIALELGADGFIVGRITGYGESVRVGAPSRTPSGGGAPGEAPGETMEWFVVQTTEVSVELEARLVNAHTGDIVHQRRAVGVGRVDDGRLLNWSLAAEPPASLIPSPHRRDVARARELAVEDALAAFAEPILPRFHPEPDAGPAGSRPDEGATSGLTAPDNGGETDADP